MHELTIAAALFDVVSRQAQRFQGEQVVGVTMSIGGWQALEPGAVQACFALLAEGTPIAGAVLTIDRRPVAIFCRDCDAERVADAAFVCATCGNHVVRFLASPGMTVDKITLRSREDT